MDNPYLVAAGLRPAGQMMLILPWQYTLLSGHIDRLFVRFTRTEENRRYSYTKFLTVDQSYQMGILSPKQLVLVHHIRTPSPLPHRKQKSRSHQIHPQNYAICRIARHHICLLSK